MHDICFIVVSENKGDLSKKVNLEDGKEEEEKNDDMSKKVNLEDESDIEGVSETVFGDQDDPLVQEWFVVKANKFIYV
ncbi:hypothetical protein Tco_1147246 [Tanacetum coccineum]